MSKPPSKEIALENNVTVTATREINSHVIGASFPGVSVKDLREPVRVTFQHFKVINSKLLDISNICFILKQSVLSDRSYPTGNVMYSCMYQS